MTNVSDYFEREPDQWGLRGDPFLWAELRQHFADVPVPAKTVDLHRLLENAFWELTGETLSFCRDVHVRRFAHGGMSSGVVCGAFWRQRGFPLIVERFEANRR